MATITVKGDATLTDTIINRSVVDIEDEVCSTVGKNAFRNCTEMSTAIFANASQVEEGAFRGCSALATVDLYQASTIFGQAFTDCTALGALILRSATVCTQGSRDALTRSAIANGEGYIYVPSGVMDNYKAHPDWEMYVERIRCTEDYPSICSRIGKVWHTIPIGVAGSAPSWQGLQYENGLYLLTDNNSTYISADMETWQRVFNYRLKPAFYVGDLWIANKTNSNAIAGGLVYSEDGRTWTQSNLSDTRLSDVAYNNNMFVAATNSGVYYSYDGKAWMASNITSSCGLCRYANGLWVALGNNSSHKTFYASEDGITWTAVYNPSYYYNSKLIYENGLWIAASFDGGLVYSEDGRTWTRSNVTQKVRCVQYNGNIFVAAGSRVWYSADGKKWTQVSKIGSSNDVGSLVWAGTRWIITHYNTPVLLWYSDDGIEWIDISEKAESGISVDGLCYINGICYRVASSIISYSEP